jgi:hypothetical protein
MPEGLEAHAWLNTNADGEIKPIGLRLPNPLGLFDMLGNAEEMVLDLYRLRLPGRLHGQAGGFVVRGGSFRSSREELRASLRREVPFYDQRGPVKTRDTGFRLVASLPVFTSTEQIEQIRSAWERRGGAAPSASPSPERGTPSAIAPPEGEPQVPADALAALSTLVRTVADPGMKRHLERLHGLVAEERARLHEQRLRAAREGLRFGGLTCSKLHDEGHNLELLRASLEVCVEHRGSDFPRCVGRARQVDRDEDVMSENIRFHADTVVRTAQTYAEDPEVLDRAYDELAISLAERGYPELEVYPRTFLRQVREYARGGQADAKGWYQQCRRRP